MASDSGLVTPPLQGGNPPPQLVTGAGGQPGAKPPLTKNQKIGLGVGGFAVLAILAYLYAKHKSTAAASTTTGTANTAPEVIAPSTDQDQLPPSGNSLGSGGGTFSGRGNLAAELAQIQSELLALQSGGLPAGENPGGPMIPYTGPTLTLPSGATIPEPVGDLSNPNANAAPNALAAANNASANQSALAAYEAQGMSAEQAQAAINQNESGSAQALSVWGGVV